MQYFEEFWNLEYYFMEKVMTIDVYFKGIVKEL